jgi:hypothetical protein
MSYTYAVLKDNPLGFWKLDEDEGDIAYDLSPCGNNGIHPNGAVSYPRFPLVVESFQPFLINPNGIIMLPFSKGYTGEDAKFTIADKYSSDSEFSIEFWLYPKTINNPTNIFYANLNLPNDNPVVGISYKNSAIYFNINEISIGSHLDHYGEVIHVVAVYGGNTISLYLNGILKSIKNLIDFKFINDSFDYFLIGPTQLTVDSMLINNAAIYKYALSAEQIKNHYDANQTIPPSQIVFPENGVLFSGSDFNVRKIFEYSYPKNKRFEELQLNSTFYIDKNNNCITLNKDVDEAIFYDSFTIPAGLDIVSSKVEWNFDTRIEVSFSDTGDDGTWIVLENGKPLPEYVLGDGTNEGSKTIHFSVFMWTSDLNVLVPQLNELSFYFYSEKDIYAENSGESISIVQPTSGSIDSSVWDISASTKDYPTIKRNKLAGIRPYGAPGFAIETAKDIYSVEMIYRHGNSLSENCLVSCGDSNYWWDGTGAISYNNLSDIYINGVSAKLSIDASELFEPGEIYHIVLIFDQPITDQIFINSMDDWTVGGVGNSYSNIAIYDTELNQGQVEKHYLLYTGRDLAQSDVTSIALTETGVFAYDYDWRVVKSV